MLESLDYHVFEDRNIFDRAHPSTIREHCKQWASTAPQQEQDSEGKSSQRYRYCLHVDQTALLSVINGPAPPEDNLGDGFVNLICLPGWWGGMRPEHTEDRDERDNCWMRVEYSSRLQPLSGTELLVHRVSGTAGDRADVRRKRFHHLDLHSIASLTSEVTTIGRHGGKQ